MIEAVSHLIDRPAIVPRPEPAPAMQFDGDPDKVTARILSLLGPAGVTEDALIRDTGYPAGAVAKQILELELRGSIERHAGGMLSLTGQRVTGLTG